MFGKLKIFLSTFSLTVAVGLIFLGCAHEEIQEQGAIIQVGGQKIKFELGPGRDREAYFFSVNSPGELEFQVQWKGDAKKMDVAVSKVDIEAEHAGTPVTLKDSKTLKKNIRISKKDVGKWAVGLQIYEGDAKGVIVVNPMKGAEISQLKKKDMPGPQLSSEVARFVSLYFYYIERSLNGIDETEVDRNVSSILAKASPEVKNSYTLALERYKATPLEKKIELGFNADLLRRLDDYTKALSREELRELGRGIFSPRLPETPSPGEGDDEEKDIVADIRLAWTKIKCHDETDACLIDDVVCTERGSDETVCIFLMLDAEVNIEIDVSELSDSCFLEILGAAISKDFSSLSEECKEQIEPDFNVLNHWTRRSEIFSMDDGEEEWRYLLLSPEEGDLEWQHLEASTDSFEGGIIKFVSPTHAVSTMLIELDNGVGEIMDAVESHAENAEEIADELIDNAIWDIVGGGSAGLTIGMIGGSISMLVGAGIGAIIGYWIQPEFIGHGEIVFTGGEYKVGGDPMDNSGYQPLRNGVIRLGLRDMFTGSKSDYGTEYKLSCVVGGSAEGQAINVSPTRYNFGSVVLGNYKSVPVDIQNTGSASLQVLDIRISQGRDFGVNVNAGENPCGGPAPRIGPGEHCTVLVTFAPTDAETYRGKLTIESDDKNDPFAEVNFTGTGVTGLPSISVSPQSCNFGEVSTGNPESKSIYISNTGTEDLTVSGMSFSSASGFSLNVNEGGIPCGSSTPTIEPGDRCAVSVTFNPSSQRHYSSTLNISSNDVDNPTIAVSLEGDGIEGDPDIYVRNRSCNFRDTEVGESARPCWINISNRGVAQLRVRVAPIADLNFATELSGFTPCESLTPVIPAGGSCSIGVKFKPMSRGLHSGELEIMSNDPDTPNIVISLEGRGI